MTDPKGAAPQPPFRTASTRSSDDWQVIFYFGGDKRGKVWYNDFIPLLCFPGEML